ncbi:hypothetical protein GCM10022240_10980 [Microbacterium kribbense]|uniref:LytR/CpsA/Psr regulator C-terminal domain-containing protein n=1 Tax=Microbacterium kribbense TaxID=433645 RepID=A0ABP7G9Z0_9MICO
MPRSTYPRDSFDEAAADGERVGAHRAENPHLRGWVIFAWAALATILLIALGIVGTLLVSGRLAPLPAAGPTQSAASTVTPVVDTSYNVLILNATGTPGAATSVTSALVAAGWNRSSVSPGDAGSTYPTTTVYYTLPQDAGAAAGLAKLIGGAAVVQSDRYQPAGDPEARQLTIVLGADRAAAPSPSHTP